ncbi:hypothetical protein [Cyanothece sp. BG0011]|uniref:hypothetical protein n=1 Tax=Cyanothece sp. BG0011 TaxID=2082950 RepID=UPI000D1FBC7F|nr:hypothetical protein [Cyanothece sp. BG0011]
MNPLVLNLGYAALERLVTVIAEDCGHAVANKIFGAGIYENNSPTLDNFTEQLDILQTGVLALQSTTALIGVGTVTGGILSAVNLQQILKLREEVRQGRLEVKEGFLDLKAFLSSQNRELIKRIDDMEKNIIFSHHHTILSEAYNEFQHALDYLKDSCKLSDISQRNKNITDVRAMLINALKTYNNAELLKNTNVPGELRRKECAWAIHQTITITYQLQEAYEVVSDRLLKLQDLIKKDCLNLINKCQSQEELDFIFPEILAINNHDLKILENWKTAVNLLANESIIDREKIAKISRITTYETTDIKRVPTEQLIYNELKISSHFLSLQDQLKFMIDTHLREQYKLEIAEIATNTKYVSLVPQNWHNVPDQTVTNLYWFLKQTTNN